MEYTFVDWLRLLRYQHEAKKIYDMPPPSKEWLDNFAIIMPLSAHKPLPPDPITYYGYPGYTDNMLRLKHERGYNINTFFIYNYKTSNMNTGAKENQPRTMETRNTDNEKNLRGSDSCVERKAPTAFTLALSNHFNWMHEHKRNQLVKLHESSDALLEIARPVLTEEEFRDLTQKLVDVYARVDFMAGNPLPQSSL